MNDTPTPKPPHRGRDFLIGFVSTFCLAVVGFFLLNWGKWKGDDLNILVLVLIFGIFMAYRNQRPHIALGILVAVIAVPLLLLGTCLVALASY